MDKGRADLLVAGIAILQTIFRAIGASGYIVSGSGLRDGVFFESIRPLQPVLDDVHEHSVRNLLALHPSVQAAHVEHVNRLAQQLLSGLSAERQLGPHAARYLFTAAMLYRIGVTVQFYRYQRHTFYLIAHSRIDGLTHREILLCALAAAHQNKSRTRKLYLSYRDILNEDDLLLAIRLGTLLKLAVALDRSETQPIVRLKASVRKDKLELRLEYGRYPHIELKQISELKMDFAKIWGLELQASLVPAVHSDG